MQVLVKGSASSKTPDISDVKILIGNERIRNVKNCFGCGAIYRSEDYERLERCVHCGRGTTSNAQKERKKRREEGLEDDPGWFEAFSEAEKVKDRLVAYDRQFTKPAAAFQEKKAQ